MGDDRANLILKELEFLRKLRVFELLEKGYSQAQLAVVLGVSQPTISRMVPKGIRRKKSAADD